MIAEDILNEPQGKVAIVINAKGTATTVKHQVMEKIKSLNDLLVGSNVVLDIGGRKLTKKEIEEIKSMLLDKGLHLRQLISKGKTVDYGPNSAETPVSEKKVDLEEIQIPEETVLIKRTIRSGQKLFSQGNIVVLGDVNPGAEVIAGGSILVMGTMRGLAHAGVLGAEQAVVAAFRLNPTQLRIANHFTRPPEGEGMAGCEPEIALIKSGKVIIEKFKV